MLLEMYDTLRGAVGQTNKAIKEGNRETALGLLSVCQESAVTIGESIEGLAGEGTQAVHFLEEFCEEVYNTSVILGKELEEESETPSPSGATANNLLKILDEAKKTFDDEIRVASTVVFIPIDPKWWDGFETVWEKEKSDENTTVFVVPIPWYETTPGVDEVKVHYDIASYPKEIGALDYRSFNLASLHPDVIYIQDAQDGHEPGRTTERSFNTGILKDYTDDLVYIPYHLEADPDMKNRNMLEKLGSRVMASGLMNVNTIIVQSPVMRNAYIWLMCQKYGSEDKELYESMVKGTGSPRAERLAKIKREDIAMPEEWNKYVLRPDGSRKKIILYSNSAWLFMDNGKELVDKLRNSMKVFRENSDDVALIWRPHPLTEELLQTLRPEYEEEYRSFVEEYKQEQYGIYDDDEDFTTSIVLSDAFYGDDGAMVILYKATGKPIMIENLEIRA